MIPRRDEGRGTIIAQIRAAAAAIVLASSASLMVGPVALADGVSDEVGRAGSGVCSAIAENPYIDGFRTLAGIAAKSPKLTNDSDVVRFLGQSVRTYCPQYNRIANAYNYAVSRGLPPAWCVPSTTTPISEVGGRVMTCPTAAAPAHPARAAAADVPGMNFSAVSGQPCTAKPTSGGPDRYVFGRGRNGGLFACHSHNAYRWDGPLDGQLQGVQRDGASCTPLASGTAYAQSPDGFPLSCGFTGTWGVVSG